MRAIFGISVSMCIVANFAASAYMTGVIWFVQLVHYPLLTKVGGEQFVAYERLHTERTGWVVGAPMVFELAAAMALAYSAHGRGMGGASLLALALVVLIWISTFALQVPCHNRLEQRFEEDTCKRLVQTNWIRTVVWSLRSVLLLALLARILRA